MCVSCIAAGPIAEPNTLGAILGCMFSMLGVLRRIVCARRHPSQRVGGLALF